MSSSEERRLLARIADLEAMMRTQSSSDAAKTRNEIDGLKSELMHVRGTDPGHAR